MENLVKEIKIKEILRKRGKTQRWLADEVGISPMHMSFIANGQIKNPSMIIAVKIARALKKKIESIWIMD